MREIFAAILLLGIIILSALNIIAIVSLTESTEAAVSTSLSYFYIGDINSALIKANSAKEIWDSKKLFISCVLRQDRTDTVSRLIDEYIYTLENDTCDAKLTAKSLLARLTSISDSEKISLGSIF